MNINHVRTLSGEVHWSDLEDRHPGQTGDPMKAAEGFVEEVVGQVQDGGEWIIGVEVWHGVFGGAHHDPNPATGTAPLPSRTADAIVDALSRGQVQEVTITPIAWVPKANGRGRKRRRLPGESDLHQLTPSASFPATKTVMYPHPIYAPEGTRLGFMARTSQKDRGAHVRVTFFTSSTLEH